MGHHVQTKFSACAFAGQACPSRVGGGQTGAFSVAGHGTALGVRQVFVQPFLALAQGLRMGQHHLDAFKRRRLAQQVVAH